MSSRIPAFLMILGALSVCCGLLAGCTTYNSVQSTRTTIQVDPSRLDFGDQTTELTFLIKFGETGNSLDWRLVDVPDWITPVPFSGNGVELVRLVADRSQVGTGETRTKMRILGATDYAELELRITK